MGSGKVLLGVLAGVAVGATLGILFAPDKGEVTRKKISDKGDDYAEELEGKFNDFITSVTRQLEVVKENNHISRDGEFKTEEAVSEVKAAAK